MSLPNGIRMAVVGLALLAGIALVANATEGSEGEECGGHGKHHKHGKHGFGFGHFEERVDQLGLDDNTRKAVVAVLDEARAQHRAQKDERRAARHKLDELLANPATTEADLMAQVDADQALHTEAHKAKLRALLAIRGLLTPEQWETFRKRPERGDESHSHGPEKSS